MPGHRRLPEWIDAGTLHQYPVVLPLHPQMAGLSSCCPVLYVAVAAGIQSEVAQEAGGVACTAGPVLRDNPCQPAEHRQSGYLVHPQSHLPHRVVVVQMVEKEGVGAVAAHVEIRPLGLDSGAEGLRQSGEHPAAKLKMGKIIGHVSHLSFCCAMDFF